MLSPHPEDDLRRLREICLALPDSTEVISRGSPVFRTPRRIFAYFWHDHHGDGLTAACVMTESRDAQAMLLEADPVLFRWLPYLGPSGWVGMDLATPDLDWGHVADRVRASYALAQGPARRR